MGELKHLSYIIFILFPHCSQWGRFFVTIRGAAPGKNDRTYSTVKEQGLRSNTMRETTQQVQRILDQLLEKRNEPRILEAGCGSQSHVVFPKSGYFVGIDISRQQLDRNTVLNEKILGDIQTFPLPASSFDVIICWDVLEHLKHPYQAISNFIRSLRPNGILILAFPNVLSLKGMIAKATPHIFHVWVYRYLLGFKNAGTDDNAPFPTHLRLALNPFTVRRFFLDQHFDALLSLQYESPMQQKVCREHVTARIFVFLITSLSRLVSAKKIDLSLSDCIFVFAKRAA